MLIKVKKAWEDSGFCRKYYRDIETNKLYVRQEEAEGVFCWYTAINDNCWFEPEHVLSDDMKIEIIGEIEERKKEEYRFEYMMLDRLRSDVEYFLGWGKRMRFDRLVDASPQCHIDEMKKLYDLLPVKPQWLSYEKILEYEKELTG